MRDIQKEIERLCKKYGTRNPYKLAKEMGIIIQYADLGKTRGFCYYAHRIKQVFLNENLSEPIERFILAHEIGHLVMHPQHNAPFLSTTFFSRDRYETEANLFALHMLISDEDLNDYPEYTVDAWTAILGLPRELVALRFFKN